MTSNINPKQKFYVRSIWDPTIFNTIHWVDGTIVFVRKCNLSSSPLRWNFLTWHLIWRNILGNILGKWWAMKIRLLFHIWYQPIVNPSGDYLRLLPTTNTKSTAQTSLKRLLHDTLSRYLERDSVWFFAINFEVKEGLKNVVWKDF